MDQLFADVILPLAVRKRYTYLIPDELKDYACVGCRVLVQFGKSKFYTAVIAHLHNTPPGAYKPKPIAEILDEEPVILPEQLALWQWVADYYLCSEGEVMLAGMPAGLRLESETRIQLRSYEDGITELTDQEYFLVEALQQVSDLSIREAGEVSGLKNPYPLVKRMVDRGIIMVRESVKTKFKPLEETIVRLTNQADDEENLASIFAELEKRAPKQVDLLMKYISLSKRYQEKTGFVPKKVLLENSEGSDSSLKSLVKKGVFSLEKRIISRLNSHGEETEATYDLSPAQESALEEIKQYFNDDKPVLLQGITGSGKTLLYEKLIKEVLDQGKQALYLLPEIALTTQIIERMHRVFGKNVLVYHSKISDSERVETWAKLIQNPDQPLLIVGPRSALFLPLPSPGLIVVDEEHEPSFKQYDPAPRYQARDTAIVLASITKAKIILGSATPSIETYYNALMKKYGHVKLAERFGEAVLPEMIVTDLKSETKRKTMKSHFSSVLIREIEEALEKKQQVILFQNRRGYVPVLQCDTCGWIPQCIQCDVSLTYHRKDSKLVCHYCGFRQTPPSACEACGSTGMKMKGFGTEKIEDDLQLIFPDVRIGRMDLDATRSKNAFKNIVSDFSTQKLDILVGTQMLSKGFDFSHVALVGILNADALLHFPDFRAYERGFQLMTQVSGRAGRKDHKGKVVIQTWQPDHPVINYVVNHDYEGMANRELQDRKHFHYPPFNRLIRITVKHKNEELLDKAVNELRKQLSGLFGNRLLGPETPFISRVRNDYIRNFSLKFSKGELIAGKQRLGMALTYFATSEQGKKVKVIVDVDPG